MITFFLFEDTQTGALFQHFPGVGKTKQTGANYAPLANFLLSYTLNIEKPEVGKRQPVTARGGKLPTPATPNVRPALRLRVCLQLFRIFYFSKRGVKIKIKEKYKHFFEILGTKKKS